MKSLNLGASWAPRMLQAASQIQDSRDLVDHLVLALLAARFRAATAAALAFFARATRASGVIVSNARRPSNSAPFRPLLAEVGEERQAAASWPYRIS